MTCPAEQTSRRPPRVRVLHNSDPLAMLSGYAPEHLVVEVFAYDDGDVTGNTTDDEVAERAFVLFNIGDDREYAKDEPSHLAVEYRARGNRSLSVGDVVSVEGRFLAVMACSWQPIAPPRQGSKA